MNTRELSTADDSTVSSTRRGALAALLAGAALGLSPIASPTGFGAEAKRNKSRKKNRNGKNRNKGNGKNRNNGNGNGRRARRASVNRAQRSNVTFVSNSTPIQRTGLVTGTASCPDGFMPVNGGFVASDANVTGLVGSAPVDADRSWSIQVNVDSHGANGSLDVTAICLEAGSAGVNLASQATPRNGRRRTRTR
jgi:hypothetical protein